MKVLITSTSTEMASRASLAEGVVEAMGWEVQASDPAGAATVDEGVAPVERADLVLALVGWRCGPMPGPIQGWDGAAPWVRLEVRRAFALGRPVLVMMASEAWSEREEHPRARALMADFRAEIARLALEVDPETDADTPIFRSLLETELTGYRDRSSGPALDSARSSRSGLTQRTWPPPAYPRQPWPLLLPYSHPDLLAGRERDIEELVGRLAEAQPILGLHALSGTGKSSLLAGGLVPRLRADGRPTAFDRHPGEPGLAARLIGDLLDGPAAALALDDGDHRTFVDLVLLAGRRAGAPPILILDQLEDLLRGDRRGRAVLGALLAATVQRQPGVEGAPCRWLLAYRREFHGELVLWFKDALREARALGLEGSARLPHDLGGYDRFHDWPLTALGTPRGVDDDPEAAAARGFGAALTAPLILVDESGRSRYPWRFEGDGAERLAGAFAAARLDNPDAPLVPELQVVLAHLVAAADRPKAADRPATLVVPEQPAALIDNALEQHLERALEAAFPAGDRVGRTRALLALHELADQQGRRGRARAGDELVRAIGHQGREVLEKLQAPTARLVVAIADGDQTVYVLSHDRLAEVIVAAVRGEGRLAVDPELLALRRFVALRSELFHGGERAAATVVSAAQVTGIEKHADCLLADRERRDWWDACRAHRRQDRRKATTKWAAVAAVLVLGGWLSWSHFAIRAAREALLELVTVGEPEAAFAAVGEALADPEIAAARVLARLELRASPSDILELGMGGASQERRYELVLETAELLLPSVTSSDPHDPVALASLLWALDHGPGRDPDLADRARRLRDRALAGLRERHPPPRIVADDPSWVTVPAGTFRMGTEAGGNGRDNEKPAHDVTLGAFRMLAHEVTNAEYRRLDPSHEGEADFPARFVTWYEAYIYAAWLSGPGSVGRLPTEAEWEHAARAGCDFEYCFEDGSEANVDDVAWTARTSRDPETREPGVQPVRRLAPNPWGLYDIYGSLLEWTDDWHGPYSSEAQVNPNGPTGGRLRVDRGGSFLDRAALARPAHRLLIGPAVGQEVQGFRPVLAVPPSAGR